jgi:uncharacterized DUF497 family protein
MKTEWDPKKAKENLKEHGVSFEEAATALSDPMAATGHDPDHSLYEDGLLLSAFLRTVGF